MYRMEGNTYSKIKNFRELINKKESEIDELTTIKTSLTESMIREIKSLIILIPYSNKMLNEAFFQQKEKKKSDRPMYEFIKNDLIERLFKEEDRKQVKLESITDYCFSAVYQFLFSYKGHEFRVGIPNINNVNIGNFENMRYGQYTLYHQDTEHSYTWITESYHLEDIADAIEKFVKGAD